jgi:DNA-binding MltR family transcriptional regulator
MAKPKKRPSTKPLKPLDMSEDVSIFIKQLNEETDRGAALVGLAYLDELLWQLFKAKSSDKEIAERLLDDPNGLSASAARADVARCLGWIGTQMHADLKKIRNIRNAFAHRFEALTFSDPEIRAYCNELNTIKLHFPADCGYVSGARKDFSIAAMLIAAHLDGYIRQAMSSVEDVKSERS